MDGPNSLPIGQQRIAVLPSSTDYRRADANFESYDSLIGEPNGETVRIRHDYRQEIIAEAGGLRLVRLRVNNGKRYRQGV